MTHTQLLQLPPLGSKKKAESLMRENNFDLVSPLVAVQTIKGEYDPTLGPYGGWPKPVYKIVLLAQAIVEMHLADQPYALVTAANDTRPRI